MAGMGLSTNLMSQVVCLLVSLYSLRCVLRPFVVDVYCTEAALGRTLRSVSSIPFLSASRFAQPPAWSQRADLTFGLAAVDAVNASHLMLQVGVCVRVMPVALLLVRLLLVTVLTLEEFVAVAAITRFMPQFIEGATGKVLDESWIVQ